MIDENDAINGGDDDIASALAKALDEGNESDDATIEDDVGDIGDVDVLADQAAPADRPRDEKGRFATKAGDNAAKTTLDQQAVTSAPVQTPEGHQGAAPGAESKAYAPPPGWSIAGKSEFDGLPDAVKADIAKREQEIDAGMRRYAGLGQYAEEAERAGTSLGQYVARVREIDRLFTSDPLRGFDELFRSYGFSPDQVVTALSVRYGLAPQAQSDAGQGGYQQPAFDPQAIARQAAEAATRQVREQMETEQLNATVQAFATDPKNKYFANVKHLMGPLLQSGQATSLEDAYQQATWAHPEIRPMLIKEHSAASQAQNAVAEKAKAASQARQASKSVTGTPTPGAGRGAGRGTSIEEALSNAWDEAVGAV